MRWLLELRSDRHWILVLAALALIGLILLSTGFHDFEFSPPQRIAWDSSTTIRPSFDQVITEIAQIPAWRQIVFWALSLVIFLLVASLLSPELRKRLLRALIRFAVFIFIFLYVLQSNPHLLNLLNPELQPAQGVSGPGMSEAFPQPVYQPPQISPLITYLISLSLVALLLGAVWMISRWWIIGRVKVSRNKAVAGIVSIARSSLEEVMGGKDWGNAIIRCYARMSRVVADRRTLAREQSMTPGEFAIRLERAGLPRQPVARLTRLFESVRYGGMQAGKPEINEAVSCLESILRYCGEAV